MKKKHSILLLSISSLLLSCQSEDNLPIQHPDNYNEIRFSVGSTQNMITRASDIYIPWNESCHPSTMGVCGYHDLCAANFTDEKKESTTMFSNAKVEYTDSKWSTINKYYWADYTSFNQFDFFGYMPYVASGVNITNTGGENYKLSVPFTLSSPIITDSKKFPLICKVPKADNVTGNVEEIIFDQTLAGFSLAFKLGEKMDNVRDITITKVRIYGANLPVSGTVNRTYTLNDPSATTRWSAGDITWTDLTTANIEKASPLTINNGSQLRLNHTEFKQWGKMTYTSDAITYARPTFCVIPASAADFKPTIEVTYDVTTNDTEGTVLTRENVTSTIELNATNFKDYKGGKPDIITPINILIVPSYLYVLADEDQHAGVIVIDK